MLRGGMPTEDIWALESMGSQQLEDPKPNQFQIHWC